LDVINAVLDVYRADYEDLDIDETPSPINIPSISVILDFVCYDLVNSATLMSFRTNRRTILVLWQGMDRELETCENLMERITQSLVFAEGLPIPEPSKIS